MKPIIYLIAAASAIIVGCNKSETAPSKEQHERYIFFSHGVDTKATLINGAADMTGKEFAVVGFEYDNSTSWNEYQATAVPNVFYNDEGTDTIPVETLTCDSEAGVNATTIASSYSPLQGWSNTKKYAFFAYYPNSVGNDYVKLVNLNGTTYTAGAPVIKYTMDPNDYKASMIDLMTASPKTDLDGNSSSVTSRDVTFNFTHRLSSLGLKVKNSSEGSIMINSVSFILSGIKHKEVIIPLNGGSVTKSSESSTSSATLDLTLTDSEKILSPNGDTEISDKLIFIPQEQNLSVKVRIGYTRLPISGVSSGYEDTFSLADANALSTLLEEGKKHIVQVNFTDSKVEIKAVVDTQGWMEMPPVDDTFN